MGCGASRGDSTATLSRRAQGAADWAALASYKDELPEEDDAGVVVGEEKHLEAAGDSR